MGPGMGPAPAGSWAYAQEEEPLLDGSYAASPRFEYPDCGQTTRVEKLFLAGMTTVFGNTAVSELSEERDSNKGAVPANDVE